MVHLGMLEGEVAPWRGRVVEQFEVAAPCGGFLDVRLPLGAELQAGDTFGFVRRLDGEVRVRITLDRPGLLAAVRRAPSVQPGERIARLFTDFGGPEVP
jgi:predicted deacylase